MITDRWPVIVGVGQVEQRENDPLKAAEPLELMVRASLQAAEDAGATGLLAQVDSVRVVRGIWSYRNPAKVVAERIGRGNAQTALTPIGGNQVQATVNQTCLDILEGRNDVVLVTGGECGNTQGKAQKLGIRPAWSEAPGTPDLYIGHDVSMSDDAEKARGIRAPIQLYPMFENALRHARGESIEAHLKRISELWAGFAQVAKHNPHAWLRDGVSAEAIRTQGPDNRPISFPYPKLMNSNSRVDQGAALLVCSVATARRMGIPESQWVYAWAGTDAHDHLHVSHRDNLYTSPAIRIAGGRALELAGLTIADIAHVDVYSCFPVAVQVGANELGLAQDRPLTVTGGLTFAGGPLNNYVMHGIATMVEVLRRDAGRKGLVTANGGFLTKHAFGVYSTAPPAQAFRHQDVQDEVDALPSRDVVVDFNGAVTLESYTVMYGNDGPQVAHCAALLPDGRRTWANTADPAVMNAMTKEEFCGRAARIDGAGNIDF
jgi:acetyl-CoA C-acetyltransferase